MDIGEFSIMFLIGHYLLGAKLNFAACYVAALAQNTIQTWQGEHKLFVS
jgi:hypothetical protein